MVQFRLVNDEWLKPAMVDDGEWGMNCVCCGDLHFLWAPPRAILDPHMAKRVPRSSTLAQVW